MNLEVVKKFLKNKEEISQRVVRGIYCLVVPESIQLDLPLGERLELEEILRKSPQIEFEGKKYKVVEPPRLGLASFLEKKGAISIPAYVANDSCEKIDIEEYLVV